MTIIQESTPNKRYWGLGMDEMARDMERVITALNSSGTGLQNGDVVFVSSVEDLPTPTLNAIQLEDYVTYWFTTTVDLQGNRIIGGQNSVILGSSSENSRIKSTGLLEGTALISSEYTLPIRHITLESPTIFDLDADGNANQALDWYGVNFEGSSDIGRIANYTNFIAVSMAFLGVSGLVLDGSVGTIGLSDTLFQGDGTGTIITIPSTATITRRFRISYSSFVVFGGSTGLDVSVSASIPVEGYILDTVNFSGGATYTTGVAYSDNKSRWSECRGVRNSDHLDLLSE